MTLATAQPIRVAFMLFYVEAWDSLAETHRLMLTDPRFEVLVVAVPRKLTGDSGFDDASAGSAFLAAAGIEHEVWAAADDGADAAVRLRDWAPDYVFVNYPWQRNYQKALRPDRLVEFTRIAYVPYYSLSLVQEPDGQGGFIGGVAPHYFTQRMHQLASLVFVQSGDVRDAFAGTERGTHGVVAVGSPKLDALVAEVGAVADSASGEQRRRVTIAPHHSYSQHWLNFGTFAQLSGEFLQIAMRNPRVDFVLRAHPFMWGTLVDRGVMTRADLAEWRAAWDALPNTIDGSGMSLAEVFDCDLMVSDGISFLAEYPIATGRAGLFIERPDHWPFTALGELAAAANRRIDWMAGLDQLEAAMLAEPVGLARQLEALRAGAVSHYGQAANRIVEAVLSHWRLQPGLVDPTELTDVPWELQAGREPQD